MAAEIRRCAQCDAEMPADSSAALCPKCLLALGFESQSPDTDRTAPYASAFAPPTPAELARRFPQLEILELLGRGGMGAVYKARQKHLDRMVAVKILPPDIGRDPAFAERFAREARSLARLSHPSIVGVYDFGQTEGLFYFIMEYIDGTNLRQLIESRSLSPREALAIVPQICDALQFAHDEGIVHRDIKPENVLVDRRGRVKIADFGLAKLLGHNEADHTLTGTNQIMGTPHYMAPEQVEDPQHVDHRADIYSLGVVFYEMLTGELPIGRFAPPSKKVQVDVRLDEVVLKALEKEPQHRYQRASEVKTQVEHLDDRGTNPATAIHALGDATRTGFPSDHSVEREVRLPAIALIVTAMLNLFGLPFAVSLLTPAIARDDTSRFFGIMIFVVIACLFVFPIVMLIAGLKMKRLEAYGLAVIGCIMAIIVSPGSFFIGLPVGVWSLVVLCQRDVRTAFKHTGLVRDGTVRPMASETSSTAAPFLDDNAERDVRGPAIGLIATAIFAWIGTLFIVPALAYLAAAESSQFPEELMPAIIACMLFFPAVMLVAGLKMKRLEAYWLAIVGSVMAMITSPGSLIGFPIGIWSLVVLSRHDVRVAFRQGGESVRQPDAEIASRPKLVPVLATFNIIAAVVLMLVTSAEDPQLETLPHGWRIWAYVETVLGFVAAAGLFTASIGLYLWKPWARKLIIAVCLFGLISVVVDMPYVTRAVIPMAFEDMRQFAITEGADEVDANDYAELAATAIVAGVLFVGLTWLIGQLVYFTRPTVIVAFEEAATVNANRHASE